MIIISIMWYVSLSASAPAGTNVCGVKSFKR